MAALVITCTLVLPTDVFERASVLIAGKVLLDKLTADAGERWIVTHEIAEGVAPTRAHTAVAPEPPVTRRASQPRTHMADPKPGMLVWVSRVDRLGTVIRQEPHGGYLVQFGPNEPRKSYTQRFLYEPLIDEVIPGVHEGNHSSANGGNGAGGNGAGESEPITAEALRVPIMAGNGPNW